MAVKTTKKEILSLIEDDIIIYLRSGKLSINKYLNDINLNINGLDKLLKLHFILDKGVKKYIFELDKNIRKFNNSTIKEEHLSRGNVKGNISWNKTIQTRNNINAKDKTIFVCNENNKNYNTKENLVLKSFLEVVHSILKLNGIEKCYEYSWFSEGREIKKILERVYLKNIYLSRVNLKGFVLDNRTIESVCLSRNKLYSEAAKLLKYYKKIIGLDIDLLRELLRSTFIELSEESTLFELYWALKIIKDNAKDETLYILSEKSDKVAQWDDNNLVYSLYHNSTGSNEICFTVSTDEVRGIDNCFIRKQLSVIDETNLLAKQLFNNIQDRYKNLYSGRPDILIEIRDKISKRLVKVIIGEVKHTVNVEYAIQGLKELIEYTKYIKQKTNDSYEYVVDEIEIKGMLFLDCIKVNTIRNEDIRIVTMEDRMNNIEI